MYIICIRGNGHRTQKTIFSFITVQFVDKNGIFVPTADNLVKFTVTGPGKIVGVDNGNEINYDPYSGVIHLKAVSKGLPNTDLDIITVSNVNK